LRRIVTTGETEERHANYKETTHDLFRDSGRKCGPMRRDHQQGQDVKVQILGEKKKKKNITGVSTHKKKKEGIYERRKEKPGNQMPFNPRREQRRQSRNVLAISTGKKTQQNSRKLNCRSKGLDHQLHKCGKACAGRTRDCPAEDGPRMAEGNRSNEFMDSQGPAHYGQGGRIGRGGQACETRNRRGEPKGNSHVAARGRKASAGPAHKFKTLGKRSRMVRCRRCNEGGEKKCEEGGSITR